MLDSLGKAFTNPLSIAGYNIAAGVPIGEALSGALQQQALLQQQQYAAQRHEFEMEKHRRMAQNLPDILQQINPNDPNGSVRMLIENGGMDPMDAVRFFAKLRPDIQDKFNPVTGEIVRFNNGMASGNGGIRQQIVTQGDIPPQGGQVSQGINGNPFANTPKGMMEKYQSDIKIQEQRIKDFNETREKIDTSNKAAEQSLEVIQDMKKQFDDFDKNFKGRFKGAGSILSKVVGKNDKEKGYLELAITAATTDKAALAKIDSINNLKGKLFENMSKSARAGGVGAGQMNDVFTQQQLASILPDVTIAPESRMQAFKTMETEAANTIVQNNFIKVWAQLNNYDITGASQAFEMWKSEQEGGFLDKNGRIKRDVLKQIPHAVKQYLNAHVVIDPMEEQDFEPEYLQ